MIRAILLYSRDLNGNGEKFKSCVIESFKKAGTGALLFILFVFVIMAMWRTIGATSIKG